MSNIGILGGTFDPFHQGHLSILEAALSEPDFSRILLMPAWVSPFKQGREMAPQEDRLAMLRLIASEYDNAEVSTLEIDAKKVSYTYNTLVKLQELHPDDRLWFILGSDSLVSLEIWYKGKELLSNFSIALAPRPGYDPVQTEEMSAIYRQRYGTEIRILGNEKLEISSTAIKEALRGGKSISHWIPEVIEEYIHDHRLYT